MTVIHASEADTQLGHLLDEYAERLRRGEGPNIDEYVAKFPHLAGALQQLGSVLGHLNANSACAAAPDLRGFQIVREIGRGGMGVVFEAVQESLGRRVALKTLPPQAVAQTAYRDRFQREARAAARLHHTHIVPVFGVGEQDGVSYYAMQYIEGRSLADGLPCTPDEPRSQCVARIGLHISEALAYAHGQGVLHRDVKPANILVDNSGIPYLADFGLAKLADDAELTGTGEFVGTLRYAAPEQLRGPVDARADVYGLGVTLYELLTGRPVFDAVDRDRLLRQLANDEPLRPRSLDPKIPRDLETVVLKAIAKEPERRYRTATELADDLRRFLADRPVLARRVGPIGRTLRWCRRNKLVAGLAATVILSLAGVAIASGIGYWKTKQALAQSDANLGLAKEAQALVTEQKGRIEEKERDARVALAQTLAAIRKANQMVDAMPRGYVYLNTLLTLGNRTDTALIVTDPVVVQVASLIELYEAFLKETLTDVDASHDQAAAWPRLGFLYLENVRREDAEKAYRTGLSAAKDWAARKSPDDPKARYLVASNRIELGLHLYNMKHLEVGHQTIQEGALVLKALSDEWPAESIYLSDRGWTAHRFAELNPFLNQKFRLVDDAIRMQREAMSRSETPLIRRRVSAHYEAKLKLFKWDARSLPHKAMLETFDDWISVWPEDRRHLQSMFQTAAGFVNLKPSKVVPNETVRPWADRTVDLLRRWIRAGGRSGDLMPEHFARTTNLPQLNTRPDFQLLLSELNALEATKR